MSRTRLIVPFTPVFRLVRSTGSAWLQVAVGSQTSVEPEPGRHECIPKSYVSFLLDSGIGKSQPQVRSTVQDSTKVQRPSAWALMFNDIALIIHFSAKVTFHM